MISDNVKKGATRCAHRSLFHANGYGPEDLNKPLIGICNSFPEDSGINSTNYPP